MSQEVVEKDNGSWYRDGLCFSCTQCGHCCQIEGYVWVTRGEIASISRFLKIDEETFGRRFLRRVGKRWSLVEKPNYDCIFWDEGCTIYPVRPTQCRTFPFWPENVETSDDWKETADECPGCDSGRRFPREEIQSLLEGNGETGARVHQEEE